MPPVQRATAIGLTAMATAAGTTVGLEVGKAVTKNLRVSESLETNNMPKDDSIPSPTDFNSPLDGLDNLTPLETLLYALYI